MATGSEILQTLHTAKRHPPEQRQVTLRNDVILVISSVQAEAE